MYGVRAVINRCGVIAGPWQFGKVDQGVFTLWMLAHYFRRSNLKYIGYGGIGKQVRDLMHVDDLFDLIHLQLSNLDRANGKIFNAGGGLDISLSLKETTSLCNEISGNSISIGSEETTRPADLAIYLTDGSKLQQDMQWKPSRSGRKIMEDIFAWIHANEQVLKNL
jgi:CDP-paratose 2-epimerase